MGNTNRFPWGSQQACQLPSDKMVYDSLRSSNLHVAYKFTNNLNGAVLKQPMMEDPHAIVGERIILGEGTGTDLWSMFTRKHDVLYMIRRERVQEVYSVYFVVILPPPQVCPLPPVLSYPDSLFSVGKPKIYSPLSCTPDFFFLIVYNVLWGLQL